MNGIYGTVLKLFSPEAAIKRLAAFSKQDFDFGDHETQPAGMGGSKNLTYTFETPPTAVVARCENIPKQAKLFVEELSSLLEALTAGGKNPFSGTHIGWGELTTTIPPVVLFPIHNAVRSRLLGRRQ